MIMVFINKSETQDEKLISINKTQKYLGTIFFKYFLRKQKQTKKVQMLQYYNYYTSLNKILKNYNNIPFNTQSVTNNKNINIYIKYTKTINNSFLNIFIKNKNIYSLLFNTSFGKLKITGKKFRKSPVALKYLCKFLNKFIKCFFISLKKQKLNKEKSFNFYFDFSKLLKKKKTLRTFFYNWRNLKFNKDVLMKKYLKKYLIRFVKKYKKKLRLKKKKLNINHNHNLTSLFNNNNLLKHLITKKLKEKYIINVFINNFLLKAHNGCKKRKQRRL